MEKDVTSRFIAVKKIAIYRREAGKSATGYITAYDESESLTVVITNPTEIMTPPNSYIVHTKGCSVIRYFTE